MESRQADIHHGGRFCGAGSKQLPHDHGCSRRLAGALHVISAPLLPGTEQLAASGSLDVISDRLDGLYALNKKQLNRILKSDATTTHGLSSMLLVALALVHSDENKEVHMLLRSILRDIDPNALTNCAGIVNPPR